MSFFVRLGSRTVRCGTWPRTETIVCHDEPSYCRLIVEHVAYLLVMLYRISLEVLASTRAKYRIIGGMQSQFDCSYSVCSPPRRTRRTRAILLAARKAYAEELALVESELQAAYCVEEELQVELLTIRMAHQEQLDAFVAELGAVHQELAKTHSKLEAVKESRGRMCLELGYQNAERVRLEASEAWLRAQLENERVASVRVQNRLQDSLSSETWARQNAEYALDNALKEKAAADRKCRAAERREEFATAESNSLRQANRALHEEIDVLKRKVAESSGSRSSSSGSMNTPPPPPAPHVNATPLEAYEHYWNLVHAGPTSGPYHWRFTVDSFPWPTLTPNNITLQGIVIFFGLGSQPDAMKRQAVRKRLARWHPDKFKQFGVLEMVIERDREVVLERQKEIVLCLTNMQI